MKLPLEIEDAREFGEVGKKSEEEGNGQRHRLKIPFAFPSSFSRACVQHLPSRKKRKKKEETNSLPSLRGGKEKGVFLGKGKVRLAERLATRRPNAEREVARPRSREKEREIERKPPPLYGVWRRRRWRRCRILASVARRSIDVQPPSARFLPPPPPPCLPPYLATFLSTLAAPCVCKPRSDRDSERERERASFLNQFQDKAMKARKITTVRSSLLRIYPGRCI